MLRMCCKACSSQHVYRDAWAEWDVESQEWVLAHVYDNAYCNNCEGECSLDEVEVGELFTWNIIAIDTNFEKYVFSVEAANYQDAITESKLIIQKENKFVDAVLHAFIAAKN